MAKFKLSKAMVPATQEAAIIKIFQNYLYCPSKSGTGDSVIVLKTSVPKIGEKGPTVSDWQMPGAKFVSIKDVFKKAFGLDVEL